MYKGNGILFVVIMVRISVKSGESSLITDAISVAIRVSEDRCVERGREVLRCWVPLGRRWYGV